MGPRSDRHRLAADFTELEIHAEFLKRSHTPGKVGKNLVIGQWPSFSQV